MELEKGLLTLLLKSMTYRLEKKEGGGSLMAWIDGRSFMHIFSLGTVNAQGYLDEVIRSLVILQMRLLVLNLFIYFAKLSTLPQGRHGK